MRKVILFFMALICAYMAQGQTLHIYGGEEMEYLGCLNCDKYDSNSIWNQYGTYGNKYAYNCIWNAYGTYGNEYSDYSPFNQYASKPPVVVDKEGNFYGYLTINSYNNRQANFSLAKVIYEFHEEIADNVEKWHDKIFN